jgi:hypothetical protein
MFTELGFYKEYYTNKKFIGMVNCEKDRETIGYYGMQTEELKEPVTLSNKKTIKTGTVVQTVIYPLNGKYIK